MKVLHINKYYTPVIGGVETIAQSIAEGLEKKGIHNEILVCGNKEHTSQKTGVFYAKTIGIIMGMPISFEFFSIFKEKIKNSDAVFLHHPFPLGFLAYFLYGKNKPLFIWYHSDIVRQKISGFLIRPLVSLVLTRAKKVFVSNTYLIDQSPILTAMKEKCAVIPFGVDISKYQEIKHIRTKAEEIRLRYHTPLLLAVGRLVYYKGFHYLIEAMKGVSAHLLIIGEGALDQSLKHHIRELGLQDNITIIPHVTSLVPYYAACDFFVFPSIAPSETFGVVQIEAMASGKAVINTSVHPGVSEVSVDGLTGLTVPPKDSVALKTAIQKLLRDTELRKTFEISALARVTENYTLEYFIDRVAQELVM